MITAEGIEGAAYVGDYQPVNLYAGAHKVAGWHLQTVSGEGTVSLDGAYNVPPDALVIEGKCEQTVGVWGTNLITNGDFSNGTTGWTDDTRSFSVLDGMAHFLPTKIYGGIYSNKIQTIAGHKYYVSAVMQTTDSTACVYFIKLNASVPTNVCMFYAINDGLAHRQSAVVTCITSNNGDGSLKPQSIATSGYSDIAVDNVLAIDLTAAFGAGNEPTAEQMDAYLAAYPNSWFNGSALLTTSGTPNSPSPTYPAPITTITGDLSITGANGDLSDTATASLGVELCSPPDGTKDEYDAVTGIVTKRCGKVVFDGSENVGFNNATYPGFTRFAFWNSVQSVALSQAMCNRFRCVTTYTLTPNSLRVTATEIVPTINNVTIGVLDTDTKAVKVAAFKTWLAANPVTVIYKLATPYTIQLTPDLPVVRTGIKTLTVGANITPTFTATVKAMD